MCRHVNSQISAAKRSDLRLRRRILRAVDRVFEGPNSPVDIDEASDEGHEQLLRNYEAVLELMGLFAKPFAGAPVDTSMTPPVIQGRATPDVVNEVVAFAKDVFDIGHQLLSVANMVLKLRGERLQCKPSVVDELLGVATSMVGLIDDVLRWPLEDHVLGSRCFQLCQKGPKSVFKQRSQHHHTAQGSSKISFDDSKHVARNPEFIRCFVAKPRWLHVVHGSREASFGLSVTGFGPAMSSR